MHREFRTFEPFVWGNRDECGHIKNAHYDDTCAFMRAYVILSPSTINPISCQFSCVGFDCMMINGSIPTLATFRTLFPHSVLQSWVGFQERICVGFVVWRVYRRTREPHQAYVPPWVQMTAATKVKRFHAKSGPFSDPSVATSQLA